VCDAETLALRLWGITDKDTDLSELEGAHAVAAALIEESARSC